MDQPTSQSLTFLWTPLGVALAVVLVLATAVLCWLSWKRNGFARGVGFLEALRLLLVVLVAATLNQPEWLENYQPKEEPTLVVLWDDTGSMATRDVIDESRPSDPPQTRAESIQPLLAKQQWASVAGRMKVVVEAFSATADESDGTDIDAALSAIGKYDQPRCVVLISDGDWNLGRPPINAATELRMKGVPVFALGVGSTTRLPDVEIVSLDAPKFGVVGKPVRIPFVIRNWLPQDYEVTATLSSSDGKQLTHQIQIPPMSTIDEAITWSAEQVGDYELTLNVPAHANELLKDNNQRTAPITVKQEALKVLLVESFPRWEYRYLRNALERDPGVDVSCLLFHPGLSKVGGGRGYLSGFPESLEELSQFDVVFLGDVGVRDGQLTVEQCKRIKGLVQNQASGLILMPGFRGNQFSLLQTELTDLYPVLLDEAQPRGWGSRLPAQFELTESGRRSLLTKLAETDAASARVWDELPGFQWYAPVLRAKAGSEVLAVHKTETSGIGRVPLLVTKTYGTGKILFMGTDAAWRSREGVEDKYHYRFWGQVARWMAYQRNMAEGKSMRLFYSPDSPQRGGVVTLNANVMSRSGEPLTQGDVMVDIVAPSGTTESLRLRARGEQWGLFTGRFKPQEHGEYALTVRCRESGGTLNTEIFIQGADREKLGQPARYDVLEEIATVSRGQLVKAGNLERLIAEIEALPEPEPQVRRLRIWCHPFWAGFLVLLLGLFWSGRKLVGVI